VGERERWGREVREREAAGSLVVLGDLVAHHAVVPAVLGLQVLEAQEDVLEGQGLGGEAALRVARGVVLGMGWGMGERGRARGRGKGV